MPDVYEVTTQKDLENAAGAVFLEVQEAWDNIDLMAWLGQTATKKIEEVEKTAFDSESSPAGESWPQWKFRALDAPDNHPTLNVSGRLKRSLTESSPDGIRQVNHNELIFGTGVEYSRIHQDGATITTGIPLVGRGGSPYIPAGSTMHIPPRPHVGLNEGAVDDLANSAADEAVVQLAKK